MKKIILLFISFIFIYSQDLSKYKFIKDVKHRFNDIGLLEIQIVFKSPNSKNIRYKIDWLDKDGFVINDAFSKYNNLLLIPNEEQIINQIATNPKVKSFRLNIKQ